MSENINIKYIFTFLSPISYQSFFTSVEDGSLFKNKFNSNISISLEDLDLD